jgi:hypothetical protein
VRREHRVYRDVDFAISVGIHVPRRIRLYPVPVTLVEFIPAYRSYVYFVVDDYICIVDPDTRVIIEVIDRRRPAVELAVIDLTEAQREFVVRHVDWDHARADVRIKLALGVDIPRRVELHAFPEVIVEEVPILRDYRFVTVEDNVLICDPETRDVVLVVSR